MSLSYGRFDFCLYCALDALEAFGYRRRVWTVLDLRQTVVRYAGFGSFRLALRQTRWAHASHHFLDFWLQLVDYGVGLILPIDRSLISISEYLSYTIYVTMKHYHSYYLLYHDLPMVIMNLVLIFQQKSTRYKSIVVQVSCTLLLFPSVSQQLCEESEVVANDDLPALSNREWKLPFDHLLPRAIQVARSIYTLSIYIQSGRSTIS